MSAVLSRLVLAIAVIAATPVVYPVVYMIIERSWIRRDEQALLVADLITALLFGSGWVAVWRRQVHWTQARVAFTLAAALIAIVPGYGVYLILVAQARHLEEPAIVLGGMLWAVVWVAATAVIWRETPAEQVGRYKRVGVEAIVCPACGYILSGLHEARCPECGAAYTLDQLLASSMQARAEAELTAPD